MDAHRRPTRSFTVFGRSVAACVTLSLIACSTVRETLSREERTARFRAESSPPGARVYVNRRPLDRPTPTDVEFPYAVVRERVHLGAHRTGWFLLVSGLLSLAGGTALTVWGINEASTDIDDFDALGAGATALAATFGVLIGVYGLVAVGGGIYIVADTPATLEESRLELDPLRLQLDVPGLGLREATVEPKRNSASVDLGELGPIVYQGLTNAWSAPFLPDGLELKTSSEGGGLVAAPSPSLPPVEKKPWIVAVFDIDIRGQPIERPVADRMSDYLAMRLAAQRGFRVVPRDEIRAMLEEEKRESYRACFDESCQIEIGKSLAAEKSLSSAIVRFGKTCKVTTVLYDLRTSASEGGATASGPCTEDAIVTSVETVVEELSKLR